MAPSRQEEKAWLASLGCRPHHSPSSRFRRWCRTVNLGVWWFIYRMAKGPEKNRETLGEKWVADQLRLLASSKGCGNIIIPACSTRETQYYLNYCALICHRIPNVTVPPASKRQYFFIHTFLLSKVSYIPCPVNQTMKVSTSFTSKSLNIWLRTQGGATLESQSFQGWDLFLPTPLILEFCLACGKWSLWIWHLSSFLPQGSAYLRGRKVVRARGHGGL